MRVRISANAHTHTHSHTHTITHAHTEAETRISNTCKSRYMHVRSRYLMYGRTVQVAVMIFRGHPVVNDGIMTRRKKEKEAEREKERESAHLRVRCIVRSELLSVSISLLTMYQ